MEALIFLMRIPRHILAAILGALLLPLKILYNKFIEGLLLLAVGLGILFGVPILGIILMNDLGVSKTGNFLITTFLIIPTLIATMAIVGLIVASLLLVQTFIAVVTGFFKGLFAGLTHGFKGLIEAYESAPSVLSGLATRIALAVAAHRGQHITDLGFEDLEQAIDESFNIVAPNRVGENPDMEIPSVGNEQEHLSLLTPDDMDKIAQIKEKFKDVGNSPELKLLDDRLYQYTRLSEMLEKIKTATFNAKGEITSEVDDEFIPYMSITEPVLFVKEYEVSPDNWRVVPATSVTTDRATLLECLKTNAVHPLQKDPVNTPKPYEMKTYNDRGESKVTSYKTRYRWHRLDPNNPRAMECHQAAGEIRGLIAKLGVDLKSSSQQSSRTSTSQYHTDSSHRFHAAPRASNGGIASNEHVITIEDGEDCLRAYSS